MTSDSAVGPRIDVAVRQEFDFPNQSAFGTWFKRQTGTSPSHTKGIQ